MKFPKKSPPPLGLKKSLRSRNLFALDRQFFYWLLPLLFVALSAACLSFVVRNFNPAVQSAIPAPARLIKVTEAFSGNLYFNNEFGRNTFSELLIPAIDRARNSVEVAVYSLDHAGIRDALYRAAGRGVAVTVVLSDKQLAGHNFIFKDLPKNVRRIDAASAVGGNFSGSMHDKFMIVDRGRPQQQLFFGSYNFTALQEKFDPSFLLQTDRPEIVGIFGEEFDRLSGGSHGEGKLKGNFNPFAARVQYADGYLEIWFGPQTRTGGLRERLLELVGASKQLEIMIWDLTDKGIAAALAARAADGASIKILADDYNFSGSDSAFPLLTEKNASESTMEILTDAKRNREVTEKYGEEDLNSFLHHHALIADSATVLFGTNNWSSNGFFSNDESAMVTDIPALVSAYQRAFESNFEKAR